MLTPGGYLFFRESCYYPSGHCHVSEDSDPSRYRSPKVSSDSRLHTPLRWRVPVLYDY